jgi:hypothetical protein
MEQVTGMHRKSLTRLLGEASLERKKRSTPPWSPARPFFRYGIVNLKNFVDELSPHRCLILQDSLENTVRKRAPSPLLGLFLLFNLYNFA